MTLLLPNLYTSPNDLVAWLGTDGFELRLAESEGTGQEIQVVADAAEGDTSLSVTALQLPLLKGTVLKFNGGGMSEIVTVTLSAVAQVGDQTLSVEPLEGDVPATATATDNGVNVVLAQRAVLACQYATARVKDYCCPRYQDSDLKANADSKGSVNRWASALGAKWLAKRLMRSCPEGLQEDAEEALEELRMVKRGVLNVADIGLREGGLPWVSNQTVDVRYNLVKSRVETLISSPDVVQYPQFVDYNGIYSLGGYW